MSLVTKSKQKAPLGLRNCCIFFSNGQILRLWLKTLKRFSKARILYDFWGCEATLRDTDMTSVPSKKILHWANVCFIAHAIVQPCRHTNSETFQALLRLCGIYMILNLECCCKCARMRFHCANCLAALLTCAPVKEHWIWCIQIMSDLSKPKSQIWWQAIVTAPHPLGNRWTYWVTKWSWNSTSNHQLQNRKRFHWEGLQNNHILTCKLKIVRYYWRENYIGLSDSHRKCETISTNFITWTKVFKNSKIRRLYSIETRFHNHPNTFDMLTTIVTAYISIFYNCYLNSYFYKNFSVHKGKGNHTKKHSLTIIQQAKRANLQRSRQPRYKEAFAERK